MKVLYITNHNEIAKHSGGYISDYLNDTIFYGLHEILGDDVVDSTPIISLYKQYEPQINKQSLWGGFSTFFLIDSDTKNREHIIDKIQDKYFDFIIYGACRRCLDYYDIVSKCYEPHKVIMIDGNDDTNIIASLSNVHPYFKRELVNAIPPKNVYPISFSIPICKMLEPNKNKTQDFGTIIPGNNSTYIFNNELNYYLDYNKSFYGVTTKKAGWDCMRHYEILGSYCMPYFPDLKDCPPLMLSSLPKKTILEGMELIKANPFNETLYYEILDSVYDWTKTHSTTKAAATQILNLIS